MSFANASALTLFPAKFQEQTDRTLRLPDHHLVAQMKNKKTRALETLYDRYASRAMGLAYKILQDRTLAEEVTQDAFWRVWQHAADFDPSRSSFSTWLFTIVRNLAIDQLRRRKAHLSLDDEETPWVADLVADASAAETVGQRLEAQEIRAALGKLPEAQRQVIELAYFEGYTHQEIAKKMKTPIGTVHTRARLGLEKLRESLAELAVQES